MGHPNLRLAFLVMPGLPYALHHAIDDLVYIATFNPHFFHARFVVARRNRLLDDYGRGRHNDWRRRDNHGRGRDNSRLRHDDRSGARCIVYGGCDEPCSENSGTNPQRLTVLVMVVMRSRGRPCGRTVMMTGRRRRRTKSRLRKRRRKNHKHARENEHESILHSIFLSFRK